MPSPSSWPRFASDRRRNRDELARDGVAILKPRRADFAGSNSKPPRHLTDEELGPHPDLFDPEEQVVADSRRFIGGNLLHLEILGLFLDPSANAGNLGG